MTCYPRSGKLNRVASVWRAVVASIFVVPSIGTVAADEPLHARVDRMIAADHFGPMAPLADDAEFLRRASLTLNGLIPSAADAKSFLDDKSPNKRVALVDRLLESPHFARHMADVFDVMFMERRAAVSTSAPEWKKYLRE
jgi:hypothetical protein